MQPNAETEAPRVGTATAATTTVTVATAGTVDIICTVGSAKSDPTSSASDPITLTAS